MGRFEREEGLEIKYRLHQVLVGEFPNDTFVVSRKVYKVDVFRDYAQKICKLPRKAG